MKREGISLGKCILIAPKSTSRLFDKCRYHGTNPPLDIYMICKVCTMYLQQCLWWNHSFPWSHFLSCNRINNQNCRGIQSVVSADLTALLRIIVYLQWHIWMKKIWRRKSNNQYKKWTYPFQKTLFCGEWWSSVFPSIANNIYCVMRHHASYKFRSWLIFKFLWQIAN